MAQVKKTEVEERITAAAYQLFQTHGYAGTRMPQIAKAAHISAGNIYIYFKNKLDVLLSIYERWFSEQLDFIQQGFAQCETAEEGLRFLFTMMWQELPAIDNGFCGVLVEALADRSNHQNYSPQLRARVVKTLANMLAQCLPDTHPDAHQAIATMMLMAFDGYALNYHLRDGQTAHQNEIDALCQMILLTHHHSTD